MKLGARYTPAPSSTPKLARVANLNRLPPVSVDWHKGVDLSDPLGNLDIGDCVPAAALKAAQIRATHALGSEWKPSKADALALYSAWAGYDGTPATDRGTDTSVAMGAFVRDGLRINPQLLDTGYWCVVDPKRFDHVQLAIADTGPVQITFALPIGAADQDSVWDITGKGSDWVPASWGYHRVASGRYDRRDGSLVVVSWGREFTVTPAFWRAYCVAVDATLAPATWLDVRGATPLGLDRAALLADAGALTA